MGLRLEGVGYGVQRLRHDVNRRGLVTTRAGSRIASSTSPSPSPLLSPVYPSAARADPHLRRSNHSFLPGKLLPFPGCRRRWGPKLALTVGAMAGAMRQVTLSDLGLQGVRATKGEGIRGCPSRYPQGLCVLVLPGRPKVHSSVFIIKEK